jgi:predicted nucleic acid-binding protein
MPGSEKTSARGLIVAEPPQRYAQRLPLVIDCSLIAATLFQEAERDQAEARMKGYELHAPALLDFEIANVAVRKLRQGRGDVAEAGLGRYAGLSIVLHGANLLGVLALAERYSLSGYDATYLWLAAALKAPLATFDRKLGEAAERHLGSLDDDSL